MNSKFILLIIILLFFICFYFITHKNYKINNNKSSGKLMVYLNQRNDYLIFVSMNKKNWIQVNGSHGDYILTNGKKIKKNNICSLIVAYKNGEILDQYNIFYPLPNGLKYLEDSDTVEEIKINANEINSREDKITVKHDSIRINNGQKYYRTAIKNISNTKVRVTKFGAFIEKDGRYQIDTVTNALFTDEEFSEWYNVDNDGWIKPGQLVSDDNNYGSNINSYWIYFFIDELGNEFQVSVLVPE